MTPGSAKVNLMIENSTTKNIIIPARDVCQLNLANKIPKILMPTCNDDKPDDDKADDFSVNHADLDDSDSDLTFKRLRLTKSLLKI